MSIEKLTSKELFSKIEHDEKLLHWYKSKTEYTEDDVRQIEYLEEHLKKLRLHKIDVPAIKEENPDIQLSKNTVRKFALKILDNSDGIPFDIMELLSTILVESGNEDMLENIEIIKDEVAFINEDYAEEELAKLA